MQSLVFSAVDQPRSPPSKPRRPISKFVYSAATSEFLKLIKKQPEAEPGPGSYDPFLKQVQVDCPVKAKQSPLGGRTNRMSLLPKDILSPGPGSYYRSQAQVDSRPNKQHVRSNVRKVNIEERTTSSSLGPGYYNFAEPEPKCYSFMFKESHPFPKRTQKNSDLEQLIKLFEEIQPVQPQQVSKRKAAKPSYKQTFAPLLQIDQAVQESAPGPGSYQTELPSFKPSYLKFKNTPGFIYQISSKPQNKSRVGPGSYSLKLPNYKSQNSLSSLSSKIERHIWKEAESRAGPNMCSVELKPQRRSFIFNQRLHWL